MEGPAPTRKRQRLSRERVLDAAIEIARMDGTPSVSMPRVSQALGTTPMSLYRYVENREALVRGMLDRATAMLESPALHNDPVEEITAVFEAVYQLLRRETWTVHHFIEGYEGAAEVRSLVKRSLVALEALGLDRGGAWEAHRALLHYTYGDVLATGAIRDSRLRYADGIDPPTEDDAIIREFSEAPAENDHIALYRTTLRRYLSAILGEFES